VYAGRRESVYIIMTVDHPNQRHAANSMEALNHIWIGFGGYVEKSPRIARAEKALRMGGRFSTS